MVRFSLNKKKTKSDSMDGSQGRIEEEDEREEEDEEAVKKIK